jgi:hypothetical protein
VATTLNKRVAQDLGPIRDLAGFLATINRALAGDLRALFRGHRDERWMLRPSIARQQRLDGVQTEREMLEEFKRRAIPYIEASHDLEDTDWLAIAQHHGMPTRLLDWSGSALTALWFAIAEPARPDRAGQNAPGAAVWILTYEADDLMQDKERKAPFDIRRTALVRPRHVSRRITAQDGWFTLHRDHDDEEASPPFVALETNQRYRERLLYVTIPPEAFGQVRMQLSQAGVTSAVLYPDLAGVASYVSWSHLYREDEFMPRLIGPV